MTMMTVKFFVLRQILKIRRMKRSKVRMINSKGIKIMILMKMISKKLITLPIKQG